ncbi:hypothetical protein [Aquitalea sp. ASV11]|uniref:hypothetical protein n=1 Tax=Aquitalea sp. ASV11 TaxID=2795103 RepID=UPI0018EC18A8|nr:hypothetical protein [Aquitalea sp. ASV11]
MTYHDFPRAERSQVTGIKADSLTAAHKLAMVGNDGEVYAVPLFDLMLNPANGTISFRCKWAGGMTRIANLSDRIEVVRT